MRMFAVALTLLLAALLAAPSAAMGGHERPMHGRIDLGIVSIAPDCGLGNVRLTFLATGLATHFGRMTGTATNCTSGALAGAAAPIWDGVATWVAADGSSVTTRYAGTQAAPVGGVATAVTDQTIVAGTGRFAGASGSWTVVGSVDFSTGTFAGIFDGSIGY